MNIQFSFSYALQVLVPFSSYLTFILFAQNVLFAYFDSFHVKTLLLSWMKLSLL